MTKMIATGKPIADKDTILQYIPQRPPIVLVSRIYSCGDATIVTGYDILPGQLFVENGGCLAEPGIIENMAQTAAASAGFAAIQNNTTPAVGFIGQIKHLVIHRLPAVHTELITEVTYKTQVMNVSLIEARSFCNGEPVASCEMKIFLQENA